MSLIELSWTAKNETVLAVPETGRGQQDKRLFNHHCIFHFSPFAVAAAGCLGKSDDGTYNDWHCEIQLWMFAELGLLSIISMVTNICLISGICVSNYNSIYPTLVWIPTNFLIEIFSLFVAYLLDYARIDLTFLVNILIEVSVSILCWLCVHSLWQQVTDHQKPTFTNHWIWESS